MSTEMVGRGGGSGATKKRANQYLWIFLGETKSVAQVTSWTFTCRKLHVESPTS